MRTLRIEFSGTETIYPDGGIAGNKGEHLATQLIINLPDELINFTPDYYIVSFRNYLDNKVYCSQAITTGGTSESAYYLNNKIYIKIPHEATSCATCFVTIDGIKSSNEKVDVIVKTPIIKLQFGKSINNDTRTDLSNLPSPLTVAQRGLDAYEVATRNGFLGTEKEWLVSIRGVDVKSANVNSADKHLLITMSDNTVHDCGSVTVPIIDNLTSTNISDALSANQGRILNEKKVDKTEGKCLSSNDYTNEEKSRLNVVNRQIVKNVYPTMADDISKNIVVGDTWTVPDITFHNLVKNATDLQISDWTATNCTIEKSLTGINLEVAEGGTLDSHATQDTGIEAKPNHKYFVSCEIPAETTEYIPFATSFWVLIKSGNTLIGKKEIVSGSGAPFYPKPEARAVFSAPSTATENITFEIGLTMEDAGGAGQAAPAGFQYFGFLNLIDLTEDMGEGLEFSEEQADSYFKVNISNELFQVKTYEHSGIYQCLNNVENKAVWQRTDIPRVGQPYFSLDPTSPAEIYGGTWEKIEERMLFGASSNYPAGSAGGESEHELLPTELPYWDWYTSEGGNTGGYVIAPTTNGNCTNAAGLNGWTGKFSIMNPYFAIYIWKRIA